MTTISDNMAKVQQYADQQAAYTPTRRAQILRQSRRQLRATAHYEAGHAVASWAVSRELDWPIPQLDRVFVMEADVIDILARPMAEALYSRRSPGIVFLSGGLENYQKAVAIVSDNRAQVIRSRVKCTRKAKHPKGAPSERLAAA